MCVLRITLSEQANGWLDEQVGVGQFGSVSAYIEDLVRREMRRGQSRHLLQASITDGVDSGVSDLQVVDIWSKVKQDTAPD